MARKIWIQMGVPVLYEVIAENMWRANRWACDENSLRQSITFKKICRWRSTRWWHSLQTEMMERDPEKHTRWKHEWSGICFGNVWDKIATDWAREEEWMRERKVKSTLAEIYQFVIFALDRMKLSTLHRKNGKGLGKKVKERTPRDLGPADTTIHTRADGLTVRLSGDNNVTCKWINGEYPLRQKFRGRIGQAQRPYPRLPARFRKSTIL